jgi:hypothetical protein
MVNTYAFLKLKLDLPNWRNKDERFDLGIISMEIHIQCIEKLKKKWFKMYIDQEDKWKRKIRDYREQLSHNQG